MSEQIYKVHCIKCHIVYEDSVPENYYCPPCLEIKKRIANEIDAKMAFRPKRETRSLLQEYDAAPKVHGFLRVKL